MNNKNIDKWIYGMRNMMIDNGVDDSDLSDDDVLEILAGIYMPYMDEASRALLVNIRDNPYAMMYLKSLLLVTEPKGEIFEGIDIELLRAKLNNN